MKVLSSPSAARLLSKGPLKKGCCFVVVQRTASQKGKKSVK